MGTSMAIQAAGLKFCQPEGKCRNQGGPMLLPGKRAGGTSWVHTAQLEKQHVSEVLGKMGKQLSQYL